MGRAADRKDETIIAALISTTTVRAASQACGISETQIYARLRNPAFKEKYDRARHDVLSQATAYIQGITGDALRKLHEIMNDPDAAPQTQLNAANAIVSTCLRMTEQADIFRQMEELKKVKKSCDNCPIGALDNLYKLSTWIDSQEELE